LSDITADDHAFLEALKHFGEEWNAGRKPMIIPRAQHEALMAALFMCAAHCQGGHSEAGAAAAKVLGVPFPIAMDDLKAKAAAEGLHPEKLWPWLARMEQKAALRAAGIMEEKT
jgi:hypothetical protein